MEMQLEQPAIAPEEKTARKSAESSKPSASKKAKIISTLGKRKSAIARATARAGTGKILINSKPVLLFDPKIARMKIQEPLVIAGDVANAVDIDISVSGGGVMGQADAIRQAIAKALIVFDKKLKGQFLSYDRTLLVSDVRRNEPHKPSRSKAGPRRHKQRSKR